MKADCTVPVSLETRALPISHCTVQRRDPANLRKGPASPLTVSFAVQIGLPGRSKVGGREGQAVLWQRLGFNFETGERGGVIPRNKDDPLTAFYVLPPDTLLYKQLGQPAMPALLHHSRSPSLEAAAAGKK